MKKYGGSFQNFNFPFFIAYVFKMNRSALVLNGAFL